MKDVMKATPRVSILLANQLCYELSAQGVDEYLLRPA